MREPLHDFSVAIVLVNYNRSEMTFRCIKSILDSTFDNFRIYVVDNGSDQFDYDSLVDSTSKFDKIHLIRINENCGYVGAINTSFKHIQKLHPDYFLIMNNDTILDKSAISELVYTAFKNDNNALISGKVYNMSSKDHLQYIGQKCVNHKKLDYPPLVKSRNELDVGQYDFEMEMDMLDDIFWLIPFKIFNKVGYYSNYFFLYGEQNDYAFRAKQCGFKLIYTPNAKIWHEGAVTTAMGDRGAPQIIYWRMKAALILITLYTSPFNALIYNINYLGYNLIKFYFLFFKQKRAFWLARFFAYQAFLKWLFFKTTDNGYNPIN